MSHFARYRIYFHLGWRSPKHWTTPDTAQYIDHSECERTKEHGFCRIHAEISDTHHTKVHSFRGIGVHRITPHLPKKKFHVLVIDSQSSEFGQIFRVKRFTNRSLTVAEVLDSANNVREYSTSKLTMAEEIK